MRLIAQRAIQRAILRSIAQPIARAPFQPHFAPDMLPSTPRRTTLEDGSAPSLITDQAPLDPANLITDQAGHGISCAIQETP